MIAATITNVRREVVNILDSRQNSIKDIDQFFKQFVKDNADNTFDEYYNDYEN